MTPVEALAKVIADTYDVAPAGDMQNENEVAQAAISALADNVTDAMVEAGAIAYWMQAGWDWNAADLGVKETFMRASRTAITAALRSAANAP
jgi:hypothetical protein